VSQRDNLFVHPNRISAVCATTIFIAAGTLTFGADKSDAEKAANTAMTSGLSVKELTKLPGVIFGHELRDVPGMNLVVIALEFPPTPPQKSNLAEPCMGHWHAGSTYVYVFKGTMRLGIAGQPVQVVPAGQGFYEPANALHTVAESASATEPASAIAVQILPNGAPILSPEKCKAP
jgi:hypothetical protein